MADSLISAMVAFAGIAVGWWLRTEELRNHEKSRFHHERRELYAKFLHSFDLATHHSRRLAHFNGLAQDGRGQTLFERCA